MRSFALDVTIALLWTLGACYCMFIAVRTRRPVLGRAPFMSILWHTGLALIATFAFVKVAALLGLMGAAMFLSRP